MNVKLLTEHYLEILSLKGACEQSAHITHQALFFSEIQKDTKKLVALLAVTFVVC